MLSPCHNKGRRSAGPSGLREKNVAAAGIQLVWENLIVPGGASFHAFEASLRAFEKHRELVSLEATTVRVTPRLGMFDECRRCG